MDSTCESLLSIQIRQSGILIVFIGSLSVRNNKTCLVKDSITSNDLEIDLER